MAAQGNAKTYVSVPRVDWTNPLTHGLIGCYLPGTLQGLAIVGPNLAVGDGGVGSRTMIKEGYAYSSVTATANKGFIGSAPAAFTKTAFSCYWRGVLVGNCDAFASLLSVLYDTASNSPFFVWGIATGAGGYPNICSNWNTAGTFSQGTFLDISSKYGVSPYSLCGTFLTGGNAVLYQQGLSIDSVAFGAGAPTIASPQLVINQFLSDNPRTPNARCSLALCWNRQLSASEVLQLDKNSYQFLIFPEEDLLAQLVGATAAVTITHGWRAQSSEPPFPIKRPPDESPNTFFLRSPNPVPTVVIPRTGENRERDLPPVRRPDEPFPWFVRSPNPVPRSWLPTAGETEHPFPVKRAPDEPPGPFFVRSPNPVPILALPKTGEDVERLPPIKENPDPAKQWFVKSPVPVPTAFWSPPLSDRERLPPIKENPDPSKQWFARSPNPVPSQWLPTAGGDVDHLIRIPDQYYVTWPPQQPSGQVNTISGIAWSFREEIRPPRPPLNPDEARQWFVQSPNPVPTSWLPTTGEDVEHIFPIKLNPDESKQWFVRSPVPVPFTWLPTAGETEHPFPVKRAPDEPPGPWFVRSPNPVPVAWLPTTGEDVDKPPPLGKVSDQYYVTWPPRTPPTVQISGMAWHISKEEMRPPQPPLNPDESKQWFARSPSPVPFTWLPGTGIDRERLPSVDAISDRYVLTWAPHGSYAVTFQVYWTVPLNWTTGGQTS